MQSAYYEGAEAVWVICLDTNSPREKSWATMSAKLIRRSMNCRSEGIDADTRPRPQVSGALVEQDSPIIHITLG